ncbi:MAG: hypothetical protein RLZZ519_1942 [Bacteroidota bacterium]|jgi:hypothetical protein|nr:hypothetical protein [Bacteroidota bacterium]MBP6640527.1 hypothetical protein [Bacteroidia bacterium]
MIELNTLQIQILRALLFPEPFDTLVEEIKEREPVIGAELKFLIDKSFVLSMEEMPNGSFKPSIFYDSDNMRAFRYQISAKGLQHLEE